MQKIDDEDSAFICSLLKPIDIYRFRLLNPTKKDIEQPSLSLIEEKNKKNEILNMNFLKSK